MSTEPLSLRTTVASVYLPALLFGLGQGAIAPVIVLSARDLGASVATASMVVAAAGVGQVIADLPAGALAARVGDRRAMLIGALLASVALTACLLATTVWAFVVGIAATGVAAAVWLLARQAYLTDVVPMHLRARALSSLGGVQRVGLFVGPFLGAGAMHVLGTDGAYWVYLVAVVLAAAVLLRLPDVGSPPAPGPGAGVAAGPNTLRVIRDNLPVLRTLGTGALLIGAVRASRQVVIPLWAQHIGLEPTTISLIFGLSGAVDTLLFYPAGSVMDRFGRRWVAVPSMVLLGLSHLLLPLSLGLVSLTAVAMLMGVGNGLGSGIVMTISADASPQVGRSQFLAAFRLFHDTGNGAGPLAIAVITSAAGLAPAIAVMGAAGFAGAAILGRWIPATTRR